MRTQLSQFCDQFVHTLRPLVEPLSRASTAFESETSVDLSELADEVGELRAAIEALCQKVAGQRSYVLIFGPLKSGKSTLMNAIAGSYVSEVSSLPAYPCLVFVSHGDQPAWSVVDYRGKQNEYRDPSAVHQRIETAHGELAEHIRAAEDAGELFDPQQHFLDAIRRIDVQVSAANLKTSGAVLVDTPGLYTRMRFGYDRMTREF
ncbi:MAG: dynamin family protein, partial [Planctomycetes bacterium]|nr:dynamin family protein [Planctomycetota bacterium]